MKYMTDKEEKELVGRQLLDKYYTKRELISMVMKLEAIISELRTCE